MIPHAIATLMALMMSLWVYADPDMIYVCAVVIGVLDLILCVYVSRGVDTKGDQE